MSDERAEPETGATELDKPMWPTPWLLISNVCHFFMDWWCSRNWRLLRTGLVPVLVLLISLFIFLSNQWTPKAKWLRVYDAAARGAYHGGDFEAAEVYFLRMASIDESDPATIYGLAVTAAEKEDYERARSLMRQIAPKDEPGRARAHFWLAMDMLERDAPLSADAERALEHDLKQALGGPQFRTEANVLLGDLYLSRDDSESAILHYEQARSTRPELWLPLAELYTQQNRTVLAHGAATRASKHFRQRTKAEPQEPENRVRWAWSEVLLGNYPQAVEILESGLAYSNAQRFHDVLVATYLTWHESLVKHNRHDLTKQLQLLNRALTHGPNNPQVLTLLANLATRPWEQNEEARATLKQLLSSGVAPATVHVILGTRALEQGDVQKGLMHLEVANERNPQIPIVLNNLAWGLAQQNEPDLERALELAEAAKQLSDDPEISDTLGTILARLGRFPRAAAELETALRAFPDRPEIHTKLAEVYQNLGDAELADQHRNRAERLKATGR
jgi:tetratricopeptide (TPR) repeat protein